MVERCHLILPHQAAGSSKKSVVLAGVDHDVLPLRRRVCHERPRLADRHSVIGVAEQTQHRAPNTGDEVVGQRVVNTMRPGRGTAWCCARMMYNARSQSTPDESVPAADLVGPANAAGPVSLRASRRLRGSQRRSDCRRRPLPACHRAFELLP